MIRAIEAREVAYHKYVKEIYGLAADTKPTDNLANGSVFIEIDTGNVYFFDEENVEWIKVGG